MYSGRRNGIGLLRFALATAVVLHHSKPLGFGQPDLGYEFFGRQTAVGTLAVYGFFVLSGMLITRSARRTTIGRYVWHRLLRILPGLWGCLVVSALVIAPLITLREHGSLHGFFRGPDGPIQYITANMWTGLRQYGIHDLFTTTTPWGRLSNTSVFDGALWSLSYEMFCYLGIGVLAVTGVLRGSRRFVLVLTVGAYLAIVVHYERTLFAPLGQQYGAFALPLLGVLFNQATLYLGFLFLLGATMDLFRERIPVNDLLGVCSAVVFVGSLLLGGFFAVGLVSFAYLLVWMSVRTPQKLHWVGRNNDYSYGIYIYGFVLQQVLASLGMARWGLFPFMAFSVAATFCAAYLSWHLVEKRALALKGWTPRIPRRRGGPPSSRDTSPGDAGSSGEREPSMPQQPKQTLVQTV